MNLREEIKDFEAAGSLADELPYWGWLPDGECLLGRNGNLLSPSGELTPAPVDGRLRHAHLDRVINRWQRALSNLDDRMRLLFLLSPSQRVGDPRSRPPAPVRSCACPRNVEREFLAGRVSDVSVYVAWCYDSGLQAAGSEVRRRSDNLASAQWMAQRHEAQ